MVNGSPSLKSGSNVKRPTGSLQGETPGEHSSRSFAHGSWIQQFI